MVHKKVKIKRLNSVTLNQIKFDLVNFDNFQKKQLNLIARFLIKIQNQKINHGCNNP